VKVTLLLAEAASNHPDGTVSMLRSGIQRLWSAKLPSALMGALVVRIESDPSEGGTEHDFTLRVLDMDGKDVMPKLPGKFGVPEGGGTINLVINFQCQFPKHEKYGFHVNVDNQRYESWPLTVAPAPNPPRPIHPENR